MKMTRIIIIVFLMTIVGENVSAGMYKCVDSRGKIRFTDRMESEYCRPVVFKKNDTVFIKGGGSSRHNWGFNTHSDKYDRIISYYGVRYNIDPHLIRAVIRTESGFNPRAVSKKGAKGLMQLMPDTARDLKVANPFDPEENISGGTRYLRTLLNTFKQDLRLALAAYNAGPTIVKREQNVPRIPETVQYVKKVLTYYRQYKNGA